MTVQKVTYMPEDELDYERAWSVGILSGWLEDPRTTKLQALETLFHLSSQRDDLKPIMDQLSAMIAEEYET